MKHTVAYKRFPYKHNQDTVSVNEKATVVSVVDGWNNVEELPTDIPGRNVAMFAEKRFPELFLDSIQNSHLTPSFVQQQAEIIAKRVDREVLEHYPAHASCVGAFVFDTTLIVAIGSISILL